MKPKHQRLFFLLFALVCLGAAVALVLFNLRDNLVFFYSPSELAKHDISPKQTIRIGGLVVEGSVVRASESNEVAFVITDNASTIKIHYRGLLPALFREGQGIVAEGSLIAPDRFEASNILAKHDERYMPPEVAESIKASGHWQP